MQSRGLLGKKYLEIHDVVRDVATPAGDQVLVKVRACGSAASDVNFVRDWPDAPCRSATDFGGSG